MQFKKIISTLIILFFFQGVIIQDGLCPIPNYDNYGTGAKRSSAAFPPRSLVRRPTRTPPRSFVGALHLNILHQSHYLSLNTLSPSLKINSNDFLLGFKAHRKLFVAGTSELLENDFDEEAKAKRSVIFDRIPTASEFGIKTVIFDYGNIFRMFDGIKRIIL